MKITRNSVISGTLFALLVATLMALEEFYEGELSAEGAVAEIIAYLSILAILFFGIVIPFQGLIKRLNEKLSWKGHFFQRIGIEGLVVVALSLILGVIFGYFVHLYIDHELPTESVILRTILFLFTTSSIIMALLELRQVKDERHELHVLNQQLEKEKVETLYNSLKHQVNPHFLFNSLSVLSSLVRYDAKKAEHFVEHFSDIYRYVLDINKHNLVPLTEEMRFLNSYLFLQRIRFGEHVQLISPDDEYEENYSIPPLSLQLVFENIFKHNIISEDYLMKIHMQISDDKLVIKNTLRPRKDSEKVGIGIENLKQKYRLLNHSEPSFEKQNNLYITTLPLFIHTEK